MLDRPRARVELVLLQGSEPPRSQKEIAQRRLHSRIIPTDRLADNELGRFSVPGVKLTPKGLFLLVRRLASQGGQAAQGPLALWLDSDREWTGGRALILTTGSDGAISARPASGHLSLGWGYDRPSIRVFLAQRGWLPWAFGGLWLVLGLISLAALPRAGETLGRWWEALSQEDEAQVQAQARGWSWLPWTVMILGAGLYRLPPGAGPGRGLLQRRRRDKAAHDQSSSWPET